MSEGHVDTKLANRYQNVMTENLLCYSQNVSLTQVYLSQAWLFKFRVHQYRERQDFDVYLRLTYLIGRFIATQLNHCWAKRRLPTPSPH